MTIVHVESTLDAHFDHGAAELLQHLSVFIKALLLEVVEEAINLLFLSLRVVTVIERDHGPLIKVFMNDLSSPYSLLDVFLYDITE